MNTVYSMLRNEKYLGAYNNGEELVENLYPRIVTDELYEQVRKIIDSNKHGKKSYEITYLLKNKIKCGYCGESVIGENGTSKNGERKFYYKCRGKKALQNGCQQQTFRKDVLEKLIVSSIIEELNEPENINKIIKFITTYQDKLLENNSVLASLIKEQKQLENSLANIMSAIERGIITNTTNKRLRELETRQEEVERLILIESSKSQVKVPEKEIREYYSEALQLEALMLINYLIKEVKLYNDRAEVYLNSPLPISPDENQGFSFYRKIKKIPEYTGNGHLKNKRDF